MQHKTQAPVIKIAVILSCIAAILLFFNRGDRKPLRASDELVVGTNVGYRPFIYTDVNEKMIGLDVDIAHAIAKRLGKKAVIKNMAFDALLVALRQNKVDFIIGGLSITPSRRRQIAMIPYYGDQKESFALVFWQQAPENVTRVSDLIKDDARPVIVTQVGTTMEEYLDRFSKEITVKTLGDIDEVIMDVQFGRSDAALLDAGVARTMQHHHQAIIALPVILERGGGALEMGIGLKKTNNQLIQDVEKAIKYLKRSGDLKKMIARWFQ